MASLLLGVGVIGAASAIGAAAARGERAADRTERVLLARERLERLPPGSPAVPYDSTVGVPGRIYRVVLDTARVGANLQQVSVRVVALRGADLELSLRRRVP